MTDTYTQITTRDLQTQYIEHGYECIPLKSLSKLPLVNGWQHREPFHQWKNAPADSNIGLRAGNGKAFIDADDKNQPGTTGNVLRWLDGLGYHDGDYPMVRTPHNGSHIYVGITGPLAGNAHQLKIGAGEFRYGAGAYVVAPLSTLKDGNYQFVSGNIARLPALDMHDIASLIDINESVPEPERAERMTQLATSLMDGNEELIRGKYNGNKSNAEAALVLSLINSGFDFWEIKRIFDNNPCAGHYHGIQDERERVRYLELTYRNELEFSKNESSRRQMISQTIRQVEGQPWSNITAKLVYLAHLDRAYQAGKENYAFSLRDMALAARAELAQAYSHTKRLINDDLLSIARKGTALSATVYSLNSGQQRTHPTNTVRMCSDLSIVKHDAFRDRGGLGRRAGEVYALLLSYPMTEKELADRTGANIKTVRRALNSLNKDVVNGLTKEVVEMASQGEGEVWFAHHVNLDEVAMILGTYGKTRQQKEQYEKQRRAHRKGVQLASLEKEGD